MNKYRIYELARTYRTESKILIDVLKRNSIEVKNHMSTIDEAAKAILDTSFVKKAEPAKPAAAPQAQEKAPVKPQTERSGKPKFSEKHGSDKRDAHTENRHRPGNDMNKGAHADSRGRQERPEKARTEHSRNDRGRDGRKPQHGNGQNGPQASQGGHYNKNKQNKNGNMRQQTQGQHTNNTNSRQEQPAKKTGGETRTKVFDKNKGGSNKRDNRKNGANNAKGGNRPHTLLSDVLNKGKNKKKKGQNQQTDFQPKSAAPKKALPTSIQLDGPITVKEFAEKLGREASEIIKKLMMLGMMVTINQEIDLETATLLADEFGVEVEEVAPPEDPTEIKEIIDDPSTLLPRPPVVTIMGHVDHGKTSLLDAIRSTNVTAREAGGITQHIGAYQIRYQGKRIVFLDTPGHEAFTAMRARGAQVTDVAILVVAADDGVMPQTIEAINHAKSANVPIIVAINKMDKEAANPDRIKQQLTEYGIVSEDWGGDTIMVPVSAHKKTGLDDLMENILLVAEMEDLRANPNRAAQGVVIEAQLDKGRGPVATLLVQKGTLHIGDTIIAGTAFGKVRAMVNERGEKVKKAEPSTPVEVLGLSDVPAAGDIVDAVDDKVARAIAEKRIDKKRQEEMQKSQKVTLDDLFNQIQQGQLKDLNLVIKGDVQGSVEALRQSLLAIKSEEVRISIIHAGVGAINESDIMLASASNALIIGFNVRPDAAVRKVAEHENVDLRTYRVIYDAINDVEAAMKGMLTPEYKEVILGRVEVRKVISTPKAIVAGSYVTEGKITNSSQVRLIRDGIVVHEGKVDALRRFKDDVKEVAENYECGISIENYRDIKEGDIIEAFTMEEIAPTL